MPSHLLVFNVGCSAQDCVPCISKSRKTQNINCHFKLSYMIRYCDRSCRYLLKYKNIALRGVIRIFKYLRKVSRANNREAICASRDLRTRTSDVDCVRLELLSSLQYFYKCLHGCSSSTPILNKGRLFTRITPLSHVKILYAEF